MTFVKKYPRIKPLFIKNTQGKTIQVYLDMKSYESMMARIKDYKKMQKKLKLS